jgi:subtilisin family serine protease
MSHDPTYGIPEPIIYGPSFATLNAAPENWGMRACFIDRLRAAGGDGEGEVIAILDTGIDASHPEFAGRILDAKSFVPGESVADHNGHGTHVGGTAAGGTLSVGVANKAKILAGKCLSNGGSGSTSWIQAAFRWAMDAGATVISMSIGGGGFLESMESLFREAIGKGIVPVVAAGNERQQGGVVRYASSGIVVAAVDANGNYATFSNPASAPAILTNAAPGVQILSAKPGGGYQVMSGTSMACPFDAGGVGLVQSGRTKLSLPRLTTPQLKNLLAGRSIDAGPPGPDKDYGAGLLDGNLLALSLTPNPVVR